VQSSSGAGLCVLQFFCQWFLLALGVVLQQVGRSTFAGVQQGWCTCTPQPHHTLPVTQYYAVWSGFHGRRHSMFRLGWCRWSILEGKMNKMVRITLIVNVFHVDVCVCSILFVMPSSASRYCRPYLRAWNVMFLFCVSFIRMSSYYSHPVGGRLFGDGVQEALLNLC